MSLKYEPASEPEQNRVQNRLEFIVLLGNLFMILGRPTDFWKVINQLLT